MIWDGGACCATTNAGGKFAMCELSESPERT